MIANERDEMLLRNLISIQKKRKASHKPPLLLEGVADDPYFRKLYKKWEDSEYPF